MCAIKNAVAMRGNVPGCIAGSDRGSQFRSRKVLRVLARHRLVGSMGRLTLIEFETTMTAQAALAA
ncbi:hypothetical protein ACTVCO_02130 [Sanguibacter sp. A247]